MNLTPPYLAHLCPICCDTTGAIGTPCHNCLSHTAKLNHAPAGVIPLTIFNRAHPLRDLLHNYKDPNHPDFHTARQTLINKLATEVPLFPTGITLTTVPSTTRTNHLHTIAQAAGLHPEHTLTVNHTRSERIATPTLFTAQRTLHGKRIAVLEDTYVTGATAQSAAHALRHAGAKVIAIIAIGRRINPQHAPGHPAFSYA